MGASHCLWQCAAAGAGQGRRAPVRWLQRHCGGPRGRRPGSAPRPALPAGHFEILSEKQGVPLVAFRFKKVGAGTAHLCWRRMVARLPSRRAPPQPRPPPLPLPSPHPLSQPPPPRAPPPQVTGSDGQQHGRLYDEFALAERLRMRGWVVPAYKGPPGAEAVRMMRVTVRGAAAAVRQAGGHAGAAAPGRQGRGGRPLGRACLPALSLFPRISCLAGAADPRGPELVHGGHGEGWGLGGPPDMPARLPVCSPGRAHVCATASALPAHRHPLTTGSPCCLHPVASASQPTNSW